MGEVALDNKQSTNQDNRQVMEKEIIAVKNQI